MVAYERADLYAYGTDSASDPGISVPGSNGAAVPPVDVEKIIADVKRQQRVEEHARHEAEKALGRRKGEKLAQDMEHAARRHKLTRLDSMHMERVYWLWRNRIPLGEITLVAGKGGIGKSLVLCTMTAWITKGTMHGQFDGQPRDVIFVANEDSYEKTVIPRMAAAGANLSKVHNLTLSEGDGSEGKLILPNDCQILAEAVREVNAVAVILDPLSSNMMDKDRNSPEVRASYERLRRFAEAANVAVIGNGHTRKGQSSDLLEAIMGSSEIGNVARAALGVIRDPDSETPSVIMSQCKNNYGPMDLASYTYTIEEVAIPNSGGVTAPVVVWGPDSEKHFNDVVSEPTSMVSQSDMKECIEWLRDYLTVQGVTVRKEVIKAAAIEGYKESMVKKAAPRAGVKFEAQGFPRVTSWYIPAQSAQSAPPDTQLG